ncbi:M14 family zinc carboxypeptidase [Formosa sp. 3Alg 14/1]|uniref:M14 family zinc carboxypeptidase n=1 Tax=Formosa sp. 3Alg 14/1 TaxID=3382190 RepID=UPI0039BE7829
MKYILSSILLVITATVFAQNINFTSQLYKEYDKYKVEEFSTRRLKHSDIQPFIKKLRLDKKYTVKHVGSSIEGRAINLISIGSGPVDVFLWSQMHGDETTATQAIFDIFNFLDSDEFKAEKAEILSKLTLHFLPMLNPDGAEVFKRLNALGIDVNRDALRLQSPEGQILKRVRDSLDADFGFNLHDQSRYYNAERTSKPATVSYLAPAYNYEKDINDVRGNAMKVIVFMNTIIQQYAKGQVGRYNDDFEPRAFGDNIQKWGTSAILIESGGYKNDQEKQEIRKLNYVSILSAIYVIATENYKKIAIEDYEKIPQNDRKLFDLKLTEVTYNLLDKNYVLDLGINYIEKDVDEHVNYYNVGRIIDQGDLSTFYGYDDFNAKGYTIVEGKVYPEMFANVKDLNSQKVNELLKSGYTYVRVSDLKDSKKYTQLPIYIISEDYKVPEFRIGVGVNPTFILKKNDAVNYAVINGFLINLNNTNKVFKNALILKD